LVSATRVPQIGWASLQFRPAPEEGSGVGDDAASWAFDGFRRRFWHGEFTPYGRAWREGDVVGVAVAIDPAAPSGLALAALRFSLNGEDLGEAAGQVRTPSCGESL